MAFMIALAIVIGLVALILAFVALHYFHLAQRSKIKKRPLSFDQLTTLQTHPSWSLLAEPEREKWKQHVNVFIHEKIIYHSKTGALLGTREKTQAAGQACLPLINRKTNYYGQINHFFFNPVKNIFSNAAEEEIEWLEILYYEFCREMPENNMERDEFIQKSKKFLKGELDSTELQEFYRFTPQSSST
jgi:hypothetical protein